MDDEKMAVVIATLDCEKALYTIAKDAMINDELELRYTERYAPTVEYLLRMLRKAFGWQEVDRGTKEVMNTRCEHNSHSYCVHEENLKQRGMKKNQLKCTEAVRLTCPFYKKKFSQPMIVHYVEIEKAGGIRNM